MGSRSIATSGVFFFGGILILILLPTPARLQLSCSHSLRIVVPHLFTHCGNGSTSVCTWGSWSRVPNSVVPVPVGQCPSRKAYFEERSRTAMGSGCPGPLRETQAICECHILCMCFVLQCNLPMHWTIQTFGINIEGPQILLFALLLLRRYFAKKGPLT
jgi:hypothetical protein